MLVRLIAKKGLLAFLYIFCLTNLQAQSGMIDIDYTIVDPSACNQTDGEILITPLSGIAPFEYSINGGATFQMDSVFRDLGIGTYIVFVRDAQNQFSSFKLAKLEAEGAPSIRGIVMADPTECGIDGTIKILTNGGIGTLQFSIDSGLTFQPNHIFSDVPAGVYNIVVSNEDDSCPAAYPTVSFAPQSPSVNLDILVAKEDPTCEMTDGVIVVRVTGGSGDYQYSIDQGANYQATNTFENLGAGSYNIIVKDNLTKCEKSFIEVVSLIDQDCKTCDSLDITIIAVNPDCDSINGEIAISVVGGSGNYAYSIDGGSSFQIEPNFTSLVENSYNISVRDNDFDCERAMDSTVDLASTNCPNCDSLAIQSFLTLPDCETGFGRIELTVAGGSGDYSLKLNDGAFDSLSFFENLVAGDYVISVRDNVMDCEKTFSAITLTAPDCNCSLNLFDQAPIVGTVTNCKELADICLPIPIEDLMNLEIQSNGFPYTGGISPCQVDTLKSYLYLTMPGQGLEGPYRLDRWEFNDSIYTGEFQDINDLVAMMNQYDPLANWERDSAAMTLNGGFSSNTYGALEVTQIASDMMGIFQLSTGFVPINAKLALQEGNYELIFTDPNSNCTDTLNVDVICPTCPQIAAVGATDITTYFCDGPTLVCFSGADSLSLLGFDISVNGNPYTGNLINCPDISLGFELEFDIGTNEVIFTNIELGCEFIFDLNISCEPTNSIDTIIHIGDLDTICFADYLMNENITSIETVCEGQNPSVGFEVNNINHCLVYEGIRAGMDTICISVCETLDTCEVIIITVTVLDTTTMDTTCQPIFAESAPMVELSDCESMGQYCLGLLKSDLVNYTLSINGEPYIGSFSDCDVPEQASIDLPIGEYELILTEINGECRDTATLSIVCEPIISVFEDTIMINETDTFCFDGVDLTGELTSITNVCESASGEMVTFTIDTSNFCLYYMGIEAGVDTACIEICDNLGNCDTTTVIILVEEEPEPIIPPIAIDDIDTLTEGETKTINVLGNDTTNSTLITVTIIENGMLGTATVNPDMTITYVGEEDICDTTDTFTYELCNPAGCDTATVTLYIECKDFIIFNGFSPNGDGVNETFTIEGIEEFPNNELQIFNRWGNVVFEQKGYKGQWNGTWNNQLLPDGTYFYLLDDGEGKQYSGFLQIQR